MTHVRRNDGATPVQRARATLLAMVISLHPDRLGRQLLPSFAVSPGPIATLGTVLTVWAHPDDETYLAGGLMAAACDVGQRVVCVSATAGERGTDDPTEWPPERLGLLRTWEAGAAMAVLGVAEHRMLGMPDGALAGVAAADGIAVMSKLIASVAPDTILTFGPDGMTFHPDHIAVSTWVTEAWRASGRPGRLFHAAMTTSHVERFGELYRRWGVAMTDDPIVGVPDDDIGLRVRLAGSALDRKVAALAAMASQTRASIELLGADLFAENVAEECFVEVL